MNAVVDLLPARRVAAIETVWTPATEVEAGTEIPVKVFVFAPAVYLRTGALEDQTFTRTSQWGVEFKHRF